MANKKMYADSLSDLLQIFLAQNEGYIANDQWEKVFENWHDVYAHSWRSGPATFTNYRGETVSLEIDEKLADELYLFCFTDWLIENDMLDNILASMSAIPWGIFGNGAVQKNLPSIHIPSNIKEIKSNAFCDMMNKIDVYIPVTVTHIEKNAFGVTTDWLSMIGAAKMTVHYEGDEEMFSKICDEGWNGERPNYVKVEYWSK